MGTLFYYQCTDCFSIKTQVNGVQRWLPRTELRKVDTKKTILVYRGPLMCPQCRTMLLIRRRGL